MSKGELRWTEEQLRDYQRRQKKPGPVEHFFMQLPIPLKSPVDSGGSRQGDPVHVARGFRMKSPPPSERSDAGFFSSFS